MQPGSQAPLIAVSTIKDSPDHVRRYVEGNLAGGVDHLVVFLDAPSEEGQDEVLAQLAEHPRVSVVRAGGAWWGGQRPRELNVRQCINANVTRRVLAGLGLGHGWLLHIDGDEVVRVDREALARVPEDTLALRLGVREAVSSSTWQGQPTAFKAELDEGDLALLHGLGVIDEPSNQVWIRGHVMGKSAVRIGAERWLTLHKVAREDRSHEPGLEDGAWLVFHYESYSLEDFCRKWTAMVASGPRAAYRAERRQVARTLRDLISRGLAPDALRRQLERFYRLEVEEDLATLRDLQVVDEVDPLVPLPGAPTPPGAVPVAELDAALEEWRGRAKPEEELFRGTSPAGPGAGAEAPGRRRGLLGGRGR
ncbi:hypothetical protein [uncultured Nocardioides sp.]|jgi:hypothetical protein|uniref:hypothetical protein n=1 Tax=uncultured Nocardioides sp. TaxID=198441 RepID=UPI000C3ACCB7|nr:hypothetical protein [uncultured Nocardioides sp.]MAO80619.1 hypothetical protein [Nocardioides sp.]